MFSHRVEPGSLEIRSSNFESVAAAAGAAK